MERIGVLLEYRFHIEMGVFCLPALGLHLFVGLGHLEDLSTLSLNDQLICQANEL